MLNKAFTLFNNGEYSSSKKILERILHTQHKNLDALLLLGVIFAIEKNYSIAIDYFSKALKFNLLDQRVLFNRANAYYEFGKPELAIFDTEKLILLNNKNVGALLINSNAKKAYGDINGALVSLDKILGINPNYYQALVNKGCILIEQEKFTAAIEILNNAIKIEPALSEAYNLVGLAMKALSKNNDAITFFKRAIELNPKNDEAYSNFANFYYEQGRLDEASAIYEKLITINPHNHRAFYNLGNILHDLGRLDDALTYYERSISINPHFPDAYFNLGNTLQKLKRYEYAVDNYDKAIELRPNFAHAFHNRGISLNSLRLILDAIASYKEAIAINPYYVKAYISLGNSFKAIGNVDEAIASNEMATSLDPNAIESYINLGSLFLEKKMVHESVAAYSKAVELKIDFNYLFGEYIHAKMHICDWIDFPLTLEQLLNNIDLGKKTSACFPVLALTDAPSTLLKTSETWINYNYPTNLTLGPIKVTNGKKIRVGYYSGDFREHAVSYLVAELFELHDKNIFDLIGFSFGPITNDATQQRVKNSLNQFIDVRFKSDKQIAQMSRDLCIDIAIDLTGHTQHSRCGIFSYRAAPVQASYLGYLGTMGAEYYDYLIADKTLIPLESRQFYKEKIVYLPSYQANDSKRNVSNLIFNKLDFNIPEEAFVFCCFNNNYKITPSTFHGWINILESVPSSVLLLYSSNKWVEINLQNFATKRGLDKSRLFFCGTINRSEYLARFKLADLFLDTFPYNAGTTASDALWAGLPILTLKGKSFASSIASSLLNAINLPELVTTSQEQYESLAIELATNQEKLQAIKDKLERNKLTTLLFDSPRFTKNIEASYIKMHGRYKSELPPDDIYIEP